MSTLEHSQKRHSSNPSNSKVLQFMTINPPTRIRKGSAGSDNRKEPGSPTTSPMAGAAQAPMTPSVRSKKVRTDRLLFTRADPQQLLSCRVRQATILAMEAREAHTHASGGHAQRIGSSLKDRKDHHAPPSPR